MTYSGFEKVNASKTDVWKVLGEGADLTRYTSQTDTGINAIDPCVKQDDNGDLWMTFGSWFGGMWMFKLDPKTGLRDYSTTYQTVKNQSDAYYGIKLGGGFGNSGEGSYLLHTNGHWYLFASYGRPAATRCACSAPTRSPVRTSMKTATPQSASAPSATTGRARSACVS